MLNDQPLDTLSSPALAAHSTQMHDVAIQAMLFTPLAVSLISSRLLLLALDDIEKIWHHTSTRVPTTSSALPPTSTPSSSLRPPQS